MCVHRCSRAGNQCVRADDHRHLCRNMKTVKECRRPAEVRQTSNGLLFPGCFSSPCCCDAAVCTDTVCWFVRAERRRLGLGCRKTRCSTKSHLSHLHKADNYLAEPGSRRLTPCSKIPSAGRFHFHSRCGFHMIPAG